jgi:DNA-binding GntR family transcriptional regulator
MKVVRLAAELGDDTARRRLERWLSRLRQHAADGDEHVRRFLAENPDWQPFLADWPG